MPLDLSAIRTAHERIRPYVTRTPVLTSSRLDEASGALLFFKCENFQKIGAFKARGAFHAVKHLIQELGIEEVRRRGVVTHSSGVLSLAPPGFLSFFCSPLLIGL